MPIEAERVTAARALEESKALAEQAEQEHRQEASRLVADLAAAQDNLQHMRDDLQQWRTRCTNLEYEGLMRQRQAAEAAELHAKELAVKEDQLGAKGVPAQATHILGMEASLKLQS